jgi:hypothetical protein
LFPQGTCGLARLEGLVQAAQGDLRVRDFAIGGGEVGARRGARIALPDGLFLEIAGLLQGGQRLGLSADGGSDDANPDISLGQVRPHTWVIPMPCDKALVYSTRAILTQARHLWSRSCRPCGTWDDDKEREGSRWLRRALAEAAWAARRAKDSYRAAPVSQGAL